MMVLLVRTEAQVVIQMRLGLDLFCLPGEAEEARAVLLQQVRQQAGEEEALALLVLLEPVEMAETAATRLSKAQLREIALEGGG